MRYQRVVPRTVWLVSVVAGILLLGGARARGQTATTQITGTVVDATGAAIPGARVTVQNEATGATRETHTGADGNFTVSVEPGTYRVRVEVPGMKTAELRAVNVGIEQSASLAIRLEVGETAGDGGGERPKKAKKYKKAKKKNGGGHTTGREFLPTGQNEESGYGLYSYLLFGTQPTEGTRERYLAAIRAYLEMIETVEKLRTQFDKKELNITYLLVTEEPLGDKPAAEWLLEHYDFARAMKLLGAFPQSGSLGPYLFSTTEPASPAAAENKNVTCPCLFQDLSTVEPSIMVLWIQEFKNQAAQEEFWRQDTRETAVLKLRNAIAVGASALDATRKSAEEWMGVLTSLVSWGEGKKDGH